MDSILMPSEIEFYIETMKPRTLEEIGSTSWLEWHERMQKLNQQAVIEASAVKEECVKEALVMMEKCAVLVHEAVLINVWKRKVFPLLLRLERNPETTFIAYSILYHEAIAVGLLELIMYHGGGCESLGDAATDLLEYAYECVAELLVFEHKKADAVETGVKELLRQRDDIGFVIGIRCLSVIRYLSEHMDRVSLNVTSRMYNVHDIPVLLIQILLQKPWFKDGKTFINSKWVTADLEAVCQAEAQVWLALHHLLLDQACSKNYEITDSRRSQLMKLMPFLTPTLLDQMSPLVQLNHWLCQMSVSNLQSAPHRPVLLEMVPEIKNFIMKQGDHKWKKIAKEQVGTVFCTDKNKLFEIAQRLNSAYNTDLLEQFEAKAQGPCTVCGKEAAQRCSKCKKDWYCSRNCQVTDWIRHKEHCMEQADQPVEVQ